MENSWRWKMTKRPAFQFYPGDWLGSQRVSLLTLEEEGAYLRLLASCWQHGSIPSDPDKIARLIGKGASTTLATTLATMFQQHPADPTLLVHDRLEKERAKQDAWSEKCREGGKKSAEMRKIGKGSSSLVEGLLEGSSNKKATLLLQSTSTNTSSNEEVGAPKKTYLLDEEFWAEMRRHYPDIDVDGESRKMDAWLLARPGRKKTRQFVINWLNKVEPALAPAKVEEVEQW
jgi:uncharacterized protein YdaU (DUF1376 family)